MHNVQMAVKGDLLTITVDLSRPGAASKTGKSVIIGGTGGYVQVPDRPGVRVGLNVLGPAVSP